MGDVDVEMGMNETQQKGCLGCCGCVGLVSLIITAVVRSAYVTLGPDDQVLIKTSMGKRVINGPGGHQLNPFVSNTLRKASVLDPLQYAIVRNNMEPKARVVAGPTLLFLGAHEEITSVEEKIVLQKDEYIKFVDQVTGLERVEVGPSTIVKQVTEFSQLGIEKAVSLNEATAVMVRNRQTGDQILITSCNHQGGMYAPNSSMKVEEVRTLIYVAPHEAIIVRDMNGIMQVYSGRDPSSQEGRCEQSDAPAPMGTAFFLQPYSKIVRMAWSNYPAPGEEAVEVISRNPDDALDENGSASATLDDDKYVDAIPTAAGNSVLKTPVSALDLRTQSMYYAYEVRTLDNVKLELQGTIFWEISNVKDMIRMTSDTTGDIYSRSRSILISAISTASFGTLMTSVTQIVMDAFESQRNSTFWSDRGIRMVSISLSKYQPVDPETKAVLLKMIQATVRRVNDLQKQKSKSDIEEHKLEADIALEKNRTLLIEWQANNTLLEAQTKGATEGDKIANNIGAFLNGLNETVPNETERLNLFTYQKALKSSQVDTQQLASGDANLFIAPSDVELRLTMD